MKAPLALFISVIAAMCYSEILRAEEGPVVIRNKFLEVRADRTTGEITILAKGRPILTHGRIGNCQSVDENGLSVHGMRGGIINFSNPNFRKPDAAGGAIGLLPDRPFALINTAICNRRSARLIVNKESVFRGTISLPATSDTLRILGTGGLSRQNKQPIGSYMWMAVADPQSRSGIVAGFVTTDRGSGVVFAEEKEKRLELDAQLEYGRMTIVPRKAIEPDTDVPSETFAIGYFEDVREGLEAWANEVARTYHIKLPAQPTGYCTWYHAGSSDEKSIVRQTEIAAKEFKPYGFDFMQIDDGWQDGIARNGPRKNFTRVRADGPYPSGMKQTAEMIRSHGLTPGIWFMPFAGAWDDPWFKDHRDWFVKRADGTPYDTDWGGTCMDTTNPDARKYLQDYVHTIAHDWGYRFFKMDGLSTGCGVKPQYVNLAYKDDHMGDAVFYDPNRTNIEAFRSGLKLVREAAGPDVFLLGCCASQNMRSYGGAFGLVDAMRVGPDNGGSSWHSVLTGPRIAARHYHLNGRIWYNDPDVVYVRNSLTLDQARANASWVNITGQLFLVSDDFSQLKRERLEVLKRVMPAHGRQARPVDLLDEEMPRIWHVSDAEQAGRSPSATQQAGRPHHEGTPRRDVVALFNWDDQKEWEADYAIERIGLPKAESYAAYDFWGDRLMPPVADRLKATLPKSSCLILAVRPAVDHPQLISTSRHVTQGMIDVTEERWDAASQTLTGTSKLVPGDFYELRIATGGKKWKAVSVVSNIAGLKPAIAAEEGLVRIRVAAPAKEPIEWHWAVRMAKSGSGNEP